MVMTKVKIQRWIEKGKVNKLNKCKEKIKRFIIRYHEPDLVAPLKKLGVLSEADVEEIMSVISTDKGGV